jgi:hypothetical protein
MKTAARENQTAAQLCAAPQLTERKARTNLLDRAGWMARKTPAAAEVFFS